MKFSDFIQIRVRFVNPEDPNRIKSFQIGKYGSPRRTADFRLEDDLYDREVKQVD
jgi:hypothetical protein